MIVLYPIKPEYVDKILSGQKIYELRKRLPKENLEKIVIYATYPKSLVVGFADVKKVHSSSPQEIWKLVSEKAGICSSAYDNYFSNASTAFAIELKNVKRFSRPFEIKQLGDNVTVPQSFCYLDKSILNKIKRRKSVSV